MPPARRTWSPASPTGPGAVGVTREQLTTALSGFDPSRLSGPLTTLIGHLTSLIATSVFLFSLLVFLSIEATSAGPRLAELARLKPQTAAALHGFAHNTRRFLAVTAIFGLITGTAEHPAAGLAGHPARHPLGVALAAVCNFIP